MRQDAMELAERILIDRGHDEIGRWGGYVTSYDGTTGEDVITKVMPSRGEGEYPALEITDALRRELRWSALDYAMTHEAVEECRADVMAIRTGESRGKARQLVGLVRVAVD